MNQPASNCSWMQFDLEREVLRIAEQLRRILSKDLKRRGIVLGLSGGIDSSVTAALAVRALGPERVFGLMMPEISQYCKMKK